ncbi:cytochrome P450 714C2 [Ziziphus jujuba]|uniref:Cytochrome P450 714C2 n=1 Tax=Ziziphus jujuba TaxID=326968 RepID=A0A6P3YVD5_ZIZJJ|nr:cytochrome P450 714C2 [Ziziphus jujuba]
MVAELELIKMLASSIAAVGLIGVVVSLYNALVVKPRRLRSLLTKQGIRGPPSTLLLGNIMEINKSQARTITGLAPAGEAPANHNCSGVLNSLFEQWRRQYGDVYVFALGNTQVLCVNQPEIVREITTCTSLDLGKPLFQDLDPLLGQGILTSNGTFWAQQRKILAPELYMDKVKGMMNLITECAIIMVNSWNSIIETEGGTADIKIDNHMRSFSGDVISRACFGSNFSKGEEIFHKIRSLQKLMSKKGFSFGIPGSSYLPTKINREAWALEKEVAYLILKVVKEKQEARYKKDLLQMVLERAKNGDPHQEATDRIVVDNCKNVYLAGYETTAVTATWCLMLLAANQNWQDRVRAEVLQVCKGRSTPDYDMLNKMKQLTMVIHESLRLYPPATTISREVFKDMKFGDITVPKGVTIWATVMALHTDPKIWGPDSYKFNPDRFANGIAGACKPPYLYMPFGVGPRVCLGQNLAMIELKLLLALIVSNFSFSLSPKYIHAPAIRLLLEPEHGVDLLVRKL